MPLTTIDPAMTSGLLQASNNLSELGATASAQEATQGNLGVNTAIPIGVVLPFASATVPQGWLLCAGQAVSRTTYVDLFGVISTTYGSGDGSTTFNLPDLRGRAVAGRDNMNGTAANRLSATHFGSSGQALGQAGGSEGQSLIESQMPAHTHFVANTDNTTTSSPTITNSNSIVQHNSFTGGASDSYYFNSSSTAPTVGVSSSTGSGAQHNNMQPTVVLNYIIKAKFVSAVAVP
jgi:microcystin-dependent protein